VIPLFFIAVILLARQDHTHSIANIYEATLQTGHDASMISVVIQVK
jgi:hypothetical protein